MRIKAIVTRIIRQFFRDKRTLALLIIAPIFVCTLLNYVLEDRNIALKVGVDNELVQLLLKPLEKDNHLTLMNNEEAKKKFKAGDLDAYVVAEMTGIRVIVNGSDNSTKAKAVKAIQEAFQTGMATHGGSGSPTVKIDTYYGSNDMKPFDYYGPLFIGFFVFFFVFLISGVSFLRERTTGTLERLLATPIRRWELVTGYVLGFGIFTVFQASIIAGFTIYIIDVYNAGAFWLIILTTVCIALCALSFGTFLSAFANNELQMIQFIPIVIVPQFLFSGLFNIHSMAEPIQWFAKIMPLTYGANALTEIMIKGSGFLEILPDLGMLLGFTLVLLIFNSIALKKHRIW